MWNCKSLYIYTYIYITYIIWNNMNIYIYIYIYIYLKIICIKYMYKFYVYIYIYIYIYTYVGHSNCRPQQVQHAIVWKFVTLNFHEISKEIRPKYRAATLSPRKMGNHMTVIMFNYQNIRKITGRNSYWLTFYWNLL